MTFVICPLWKYDSSVQILLNPLYGGTVIPRIWPEETELPSQVGKIKSVWREGFWGTLVPKTCVLWDIWDAWTDACPTAIHSLVKRLEALCSFLEGSGAAVTARILSLVVGFCLGFTSAKPTWASFSVGWRLLPEEPNFSQRNYVFLSFKNAHFFCFNFGL